MRGPATDPPALRDRLGARRTMLAPGSSVVDRQCLAEMLQSQVAWLGMLGQLRAAVQAEDWERAAVLARQPLTFPQPYPEGT